MDEGNLTTNDASERAVQILQFMVLDETIGVPVVMVALRDTSAAGITLKMDQLAFGRMRGVFAHQGNDTEDLGNKKQSDEPRTQTTHCGHRDHSEPE